MKKLALPDYPLRALHLVTVWAYAVSQPVFSLLEANPEFLVVRGSSRTEVVLFALVLVFVPPLLAFACELVVYSVSARAADILHLAFVAAFVLPLALQLLKHVDASRVAAILGAAAVAFLAVFVYARIRAAGLFLTFSVALPLVGLYSFVSGVPLASTDDVAAANVQVAARTPVVLVVLDELPISSLLAANGGIDGGRYPTFARLAREGTWYRAATTVGEHTTLAVPPILDGRLPKAEALPTIGDHPQNLFTLLGESYGVRAFEPVTHLCPRRYCEREDTSLGDRLRSLVSDVRVAYLHRVLPDSLAGGLPPINDRWGGFGDEALEGQLGDLVLAARDTDDIGQVVRRAFAKRTPRTDFDRFVSSIERRQIARTLHFLHVLLPHSPWNSLPSGRQYGNAEAIDGLTDAATWGDDSWLVLQGHQRHLLQAAYTDRLVGAVLDRLQDVGAYDEALVVVTADHGVSFVPDGKRRSVSRQNLADIARVPLFVKFPGQTKGHVDTKAASTIDILPTIADVLDIELPWAVDGRSLLEPRPDPTIVRVVSRSGLVAEASARDVEHEMRETLARQSSLFGEGMAALYEIGSNRELLGSAVARTVARSGRGTRVQFDGEELLWNVRLSSPFVPALITGSLDDAVIGDDVELAVAVNGRIAALTRSFGRDGKRRFSALVPERFFRDGHNRVEVLAVEGRGANVRLTWLGGTSPAQRYELTAGSISVPDGGRAVIEDGRIDGRLEVWVSDSGTVRLRGWAADLEGKSAPDRILVFASKRLLYAGETTTMRDLTNVQTGAGTLRAGWVIELPTRELQAQRLRIFALRGAIATELPVPYGFPWA